MANNTTKSAPKGKIKFTITHSEESNKGKHNYWKGKKLSEDHKKKIGDAHRGKKYK